MSWNSEIFNLYHFLQSAERAGLSSLTLRWAPLRSGSNRVLIPLFWTQKKSLKNLRLFLQSAERAGLSSLTLRWAPLRSGSNRGSHPALLDTKKEP
jgi:hypothetical protein